MIYDWILNNRQIFILLSSIITVFICIVIVLKTNRLFRLSMHQGIRYFRNAFFFYGLAFIMRYILSIAHLITTKIEIYNYFQIIFEFFFIMASFSLLYSLMWKKIEKGRESSKSSLFNLGMLLFYLMAIVIVILDHIFRTFTFMFILVIFVFFFASIISYRNYRRNEKRRFLKLFFFVMFLNLITWTINFVAASFFNWNQASIIGTYLLNMIIFLLFLYAVIKITRRG